MFVHNKEEEAALRRPGAHFNVPTFDGHMGNKRIVEARNQNSKKWFVVAIAIGSLVCIGVGGFGTLGLLQSHNLISLPHWFTSAISAVGHTPNFWSLWTMTISGLGLGGGLLLIGIYKMQKKSAPEKAVIKIQNMGIEDGVNEAENPEHDKVEIDFESEYRELNKSLPLGKQKERGQNPEVDKFYHTQNPRDFNSDLIGIGDYCFIPNGAYLLMRIKDTGGDKCVFVRPSTSRKGEYRLVLRHSRGLTESSMTYTAPQISAMVRHASNPQHGIRVSGLTQAVRSTTGLIIFTSEGNAGKKYFLVNKKGALEEIPLNELMRLIKALQPRR